MKLKNVLQKFESRLPLQWQESWDKSGLNLGSRAVEIKSVTFAYDVCLESIAFAAKNKSQLLVTHHPFRLRAEPNVDLESYEGRIIAAAIKTGVALYSAHTNHDASPESLNIKALRDLGCKNIRPLKNSAAGVKKLIIYVPQTHSAQVMEALFAAGAGGIGNYSECSFRSLGTGTFKGNENSNPRLGKRLKREEVLEERVEVLVADEVLNSVLLAMRSAHPYEEVAHDVFSLQNPRTDIGLGAVGEFLKPISFQTLIKKVKKIFGAPHVRIVDSGHKRVSKIGICTGSGMSLFKNAVSSGCDVFVTGDIKYHDAVDAKRLDVSLIDPGHFYSEVHSARELMRCFSELFGKEFKLHLYEGLRDVFEVF